MTRNQITDCREHAAKVIFKNSINTLHTYSKTCSGASQIYTKSLILQLKQNLPKDNYYEDNGTVKRDLSIETDICILRRYCKKKRNKLLNREVVSAKSKYSINRTEIDTIDEFQHDTSACGDSEQNVPKTCFNINLTSLVIDNLKDLLSNWIKTYLLEKRETKQKIDSVLDSILHKLELQRDDHDTSSSYTYTVDVEVVNRNSNQKTELQSNRSKDFTLENSKLVDETSNLSIPINGKYLRIISTLSLPRNTNKTKRCRNLQNNMKRIRHKKILLSISKSSNYIFKSSNLDFFTLPTKDLTKHCVTYDHDETKEVKAKNVIPQSQPGIKDLIDDLIRNENICDQAFRKTKAKRPFTSCNKMKNFVDNVVYSSNCQVTESNSKNNVLEKLVNLKDNDVVQKYQSSNEQDQSDQLITIDLFTQSFECLNRHKQGELKLKTRDGTVSTKTKYRRNNKCKKKLSKYQNYKNIKTKQFTYLFRKSNNLINQEKMLLKNFQSIFRYFSSWEGKKDIKVDIQVNVFPTQENKEDDVINSEKSQVAKTMQPDILTCTDNQKLGIKVITENNVTSYDNQNIISLLDGAASQAKYIISRETSTDTSETNNKVDCEKNTLNLKHSKIAQEINELKIIIKSLATATEKIANDHLQRKQNILKETLNISSDNNNTNDPVTKTIVSNTIKSSKCIQFSNITPKSEIISGIKIKKEPRSRYGKNYNPRLIKKSTSYKFIESESILKVTDMTSAVQDITTDTLVDEALTCSLPKSKSLFEVSMGPDKNKLLAFYCDDFVKPDDKVYNNCDHEIPYCSNSCNNGCRRVKPFCIYSKCNLNRCCNSEIIPGEPDFICTEYTPTTDNCELCDNSSSSICIDIDSKSFDKKITIRNRNGMGFWEGCLYCFLMWIPLLLISWLFYIHVIKDLLKPKHSLLRMLSFPKRNKTNTPLTDLPISLADLEVYSKVKKIEMESLEDNFKTNINQLQDIIPLNDSSNKIQTNIVDFKMNGKNYDEEINMTLQNITCITPEAVKSKSSITLKKLHLSQILNCINSFENDSRIQINKVLKKRPHRYTRLVKIKNVHFKNKHHNRNMIKTLELNRYNDKRDNSNSGKLKRNLCFDSIVASQKRSIKKALTKENVLEEDEVSLSHLDNNMADNISINSKMSKSTLKPENSYSSQNDDFYSINNVQSVIKIENKDNSNVCCSMEHPKQIMILDKPIKEVENHFTTGIVNVVVAQVNNTAILDYNKKAATIKSRENILFQESLTSAESYLSQSDTITSTSTLEMSKTSSTKDYLTIMNSNKNSSITLIPQNLFEVNSENDTFVIAKTSSYFNNTNTGSSRTLIPNAVNNLSTPANSDFQTINNQDLKPALLDTIINMRLNPNIPEHNSQSRYLHNLNNVIITNENFKTPTQNTFENNYNSTRDEKISKSTVKKSFDVEDDGNRRNHIQLPNENTIKEILTESKKSQKKTCSEEFRNYTPVADIWEKLTTFLDIAIRKLEVSLVEKISNEIKEALNGFNLPIDTNRTKSEINTKMAEPNSLDEGLQCCLVRNQIIDELRLSLNTESEAAVKSNTLQVINKKTEHILDVIKPPVSHISKDTAIGYSIATSSSEGLKVRPSAKNQCVTRLISRPISFFKENVLVIVSVPLFCFVLFLIYTFLVLVMNFW